MRAKGRCFRAGGLVWVYNPPAGKGPLLEAGQPMDGSLLNPGEVVGGGAPQRQTGPLPRRVFPAGIRDPGIASAAVPAPPCPLPNHLPGDNTRGPGARVTQFHSRPAPLSSSLGPPAEVPGSPVLPVARSHRHRRPLGRFTDFVRFGGEEN